MSNTQMSLKQTDQNGEVLPFPKVIVTGSTLEVKDVSMSHNADMTIHALNVQENTTSTHVAKRERRK